jgi:hydroxyacylglutathione hydrolase
MITITPIPAFQDNYIWLISNHRHAVVVDPGDAKPVIAYLEQHQLQLDAILITHHHADHIDGVDALVAHHPCKVYAPAKESYSFAHQPVANQQVIRFPHLELTLEVIDVPGHTLGHVAYYGANSLFCGDTLFGAGCGRLFEGTPSQMFDSLQKLAQLPAETAVYCTHEYTEHNLKFALTLEPNNADLIERVKYTESLRAAHQPSLPSSMGLELHTNPFLRCHSAEIAEKIGLKGGELIEIFTAIRQARNQF